MIKLLVGFLSALQGKVWAAPVFVLAFSLACQGFPTTPFPLAGGILFGFWGGLAMNVLGFAGGAAVTFWVSRRWGRAVADKFFLRGRPLPTFLKNLNFWLFVVVRLTGVPPHLPANVLAGLSDISFASFIAATIVGVLPWCVLMTVLSKVLWEALLTGGMGGFTHALHERAGPFLVALVVFGVLVGIGAWFGRRLIPQAGKDKE